MAKISGPIASAMRGKVGQVVAAKTVGGDTAIRAYQPQVKNPNTYRQAASRFRFSMVSSIAAALSEVIKIGYGKASSGMKMYPRNVFVRELIADDATLITDGMSFDSLQLSSLKVSRNDGFSMTPVFQYTAPSGSDTGTIRLTNAADFNVNPDEAVLGIVVAAVLSDGTGNVILTKLLKGQATVGIEVTAADAAVMGGCTLLGFAKAIPVTGNSVPTDTWPWKYPSATSKTAVVTVLN